MALDSNFNLENDPVYSLTQRVVMKYKLYLDGVRSNVNRDVERLNV